MLLVLENVNVSGAEGLSPAHSADTHRLIERLRARDEDAFTELVRTHEAAIRGYTALWAPSRDEADDIAQEVFIAALRGIESFDPSQDLKAWLFGIARNITRQAWKRVYRMPKGSPNEHLIEQLEQQAQAVTEEREGMEESRVEALRECIHALPEKLRGMVTQYVDEDLCTRTTAERLKTTEGTVRATLTRARRALRECVSRRLRLEGV